MNRRHLIKKKQEVGFIEWLSFLFWNRIIFMKLIISMLLLLCIPAYLSWVFAGTVVAHVLIAFGMCLAITFVGILRYRYWLDIAEHPKYWDELLAYARKKMVEQEHADSR